MLWTPGRNGARFSEFAGEEAEVPVTALKNGAWKARRGNWPFIVLVDGEGRAHRLLDLIDRHGRVSPAVIDCGPVWGFLCRISLRRRLGVAEAG